MIMCIIIILITIIFLIIIFFTIIIIIIYFIIIFIIITIIIIFFFINILIIFFIIIIFLIIIIFITIIIIFFFINIFIIFIILFFIIIIFFLFVFICLGYSLQRAESRAAALPRGAAPLLQLRTVTRCRVRSASSGRNSAPCIVHPAATAAIRGEPSRRPQLHLRAAWVRCVGAVWIHTSAVAVFPVLFTNRSAVTERIAPCGSLRAAASCFQRPDASRSLGVADVRTGCVEVQSRSAWSIMAETTRLFVDHNPARFPSTAGRGSDVTPAGKSGDSVLGLNRQETGQGQGVLRLLLGLMERGGAAGGSTVSDVCGE
ncbi:unnamed protein product [Pleuronectes platessa]|uniref:Uncharacterized protein n=1 Tax=Pleuronectes platessa TaxID=8262 RepID=A0A9N7V0G0_PLEPL|nr:unnamed protein product [Pleuronectes platessa]